MRYYDLDLSGKVKGHYAVPQPEVTTVLLPIAPDDESMWDGDKWVPDPDIVNARLAEEARIAAKVQAIIDNLPSWAQVDQAITDATTIAALKVIVRKMARVLYIIATNKTD